MADASGQVSCDDQRSYVKIESLRGKTPTEIHNQLKEVCGDSALDRSTISRWAQRFRKGRRSIEDDPRPGRPVSESDTTGQVIVATVLDEDRRMTLDEIAAAAGMSKSTVYRIVTEILGKRKIAARWVPHQLTQEQKKNRMEISQQLLDRFRREGNDFLDRIVALDETWIRSFEPELKTQSMQWKGPSSPRTSKFRQGQSKVKQMMIFAYDMKGVIVTDKVPAGTTVTADYYVDFIRKKLRPKIRQNRRDLFQRGPLILRDNARPHISQKVTSLLAEYGWEILPHPTYSPDLSPPDFDLFPKLKEPLRGCRFSTIQELSQAVTSRIRQLNTDGVLDGILKLPARWEKTVMQQGDYIERL